MKALILWVLLGLGAAPVQAAQTPPAAINHFAHNTKRRLTLLNPDWQRQPVPVANRNWRVVHVHPVGQRLGKSVVATLHAESGITAKTTVSVRPKTKAVKTFDAPAAVVREKLGVTPNLPAYATVLKIKAPNTWHQHPVRQVRLNARVVYQRVAYTVQRHQNGHWQTKGQAIFSQPIGVRVTKHIDVE